ncbi:MAG: DUF6752 domain-containing protein, partial [Thermocrispum sp.]
MVVMNTQEGRQSGPRSKRSRTGLAGLLKRRSPRPEQAPEAARQPRSTGGPPPWKKEQQRTRREISALRQRVEELEKEVQECRQLNKRLAEITDVVAEVLLPAE